MSCDYCFYGDEMRTRSKQQSKMMSMETARCVVGLAFSDLSSGAVTFCFQGGEPTIRGLDFFKEFVSCVKECQAGKRVEAHYALQTNGYALDREWARFLHDENFLVGLSMDGMGKIHDAYRHTPEGKGSFKYAFRASNFLKAEKVDFNILTTVTDLVARNAEKIYAFFRKNDFKYLQFIPCIDFIGTDRGSLPWSLGTEEYGEFLCKLFKRYFDDWEKGDYVSIRYFDNLVFMIAGSPPEACGMAGCCSANYVIEGDGSVFPCDFYVLDNYRLGNVNINTLEEIDAERKRIKFIEKSMEIADDCKKCPYFSLCRGGCRRDRENFRTGNLEKTYLCDAYKKFFSYALEGLKTMAMSTFNLR